MRKWAVAIGVVVIFIGIVLAPSAGISQETKFGFTIDDVELHWSVQGYFAPSQILAVDFSPNHDWSLPMFLSEDILPAVKYLHINITDLATGNYTLIDATLAPPMGTSVQPPYMYLLYLVTFTIVHRGALIEANPSYQTVSADYGIECGTIANEGLYTVNCSLDPPVVIDTQQLDNGTRVAYHHDASPPEELRLSMLTTQIEYPNSYLLPSGITAIAVGIVVSAWGVRSKRPKLPRHLKGKTASTHKT